jgi:hypothetical protein
MRISKRSEGTAYHGEFYIYRQEKVYNIFPDGAIIYLAE